MGLIEEFESKYWNQDVLVMGIDEAGRGPMAGPCVVAGVVLPKGYNNPLINDSKKLSEKRRIDLYNEIIEVAVHYEILEVSVEAIEHHNILQATRMGMEKVATGFRVGVVLADAMDLDIEVETHSIIKGDARSISIAAASILAKTYRDNLMVEYAKIYPEYGFDKHKGYGTKFHKEMILKHGRCPIHRKDFKFKDEFQMSLDI